MRRESARPKQIKAYCQERDLELRTYHPAHDQSGSDILGETYRDETTNRTGYSLPFWLPTDEDPPGVLFMDEINRAPRAVLQGLMEPLGEGTVSQSGWRLPDHWQVVAAANPGEAGYDVEIMDDAMVDRLLHYAPGWDAPAWANWAGSVDLASAVVDFALMHRELVETGETQLPLEVQERLQATPRSLEYMAALYDPQMTDGMLRVISHGLLGRDVAPQFIALHNSDERPLTFEELLAGGFAPKLTKWIAARKTELITASTLRLIAGLVGREVDTDLAGELGKYLALLPDHLRPEAFQEIARSVPDWHAPLTVTAEHWAGFLAQQRARQLAR